MTASEFLAKQFKSCRRERAVCKDGFSVSIQGSEYHYCTPRENGHTFSDVELGFPSSAEPSWLKYAENENAPTDTVYGYVPIEEVENVISRHGGIVE